MSNEQNKPEGIDLNEISISPDGEVQGLDDATLNDIAGGVAGAQTEGTNYLACNECSA